MSKYKEFENKYTFYNNNGLEIIITIILFVFTLAYVIYGVLLNFKQSIKDNWTENRCNPMVMPIAGWIMEPEDMTQNEYNEYNFNMCTESIIQNAADNALSPINNLTSGFTDIFSYLSNISLYLTNKVNDLCMFILNIFKSLLQTFYAIIDVVMNLGNIMGDVINRVVAIIIVSINGCLSMFYIFGSFFSLLYGLLNTLLIIVISLAIGFFIIGLALIATGIGAPWGLIYLAWFVFYSVFAISATIGLVIARIILMSAFYATGTTPPPTFSKPKKKGKKKKKKKKK